MITVYTCLIGNYDYLLSPVVEEAGIDYVCFTDRRSRFVRTWRQVPLDGAVAGLGPILGNRYHKCFAHKLFPRSRYSIYLDANVRLKRRASILVDLLKNSNATMACPRHPSGRTLQEELFAIIHQGKAEEAQVRRAFEFYVSHGVHQEQTITENNLIIRDHADPRLARAMESWWREINERVPRDQLSLPFVLNEHKVPFAVLPFDGRVDNQYIERVDHRKRGLRGIWQYVRIRRNDNRFWTMLYRRGEGVKRLRRRVLE